MRSPLQPVLRLPLSLPMDRVRRGGGSSWYDAAAVFGADLVTFYGESIQRLWTVQAGGGAVTLYQDRAGTTPVSAIGQTVGRIIDLSGNGFHLTAPSDGARMTLETDGTSAYLDADGATCAYTTAAIDLTSTDAISAIGTLQKDSDASLAVFFEFSPSVAGNAGSFAVLAPPGSSYTGLGFQYRGDGSQRNVNNNTFPAPLTAVLDLQADISGPYIEGWVNGVSAGSSISSAGSGNFGDYSLYVGARNASSARLNGRIYALPMIVKRLITSEEATEARTVFAESIGGLE